MNFLLILATFLLIGIAGWLWHLSNAQKTYMSLEASLAPVQNVTSTPLLKPSAFNIWYKKAVAFLMHKLYMFQKALKKWYKKVIALITNIFPLVVMLGLILGLAGSIYLISLIIKKSVWTSSIILGIVILALVLALSEALVIKYRHMKKIEIAEIKGSGIVIGDICGISGQNSIGSFIQKITIYRKIIEYAGEAILPKKVYVNDSHNISINLKPISETFPTLHSEKPLSIQDIKSGKSIILQIQRDSTLEQFLEIQLLAAGLIVDGDKIQRQSLTLPTLSYYWNCYSPNSGDHVINLIIRVVSQPYTIELGTIQHSIKVAQLDHLTQRQVQWTGIITGGLGISVLLQQLGVL